MSMWEAYCSFLLLLLLQFRHEQANHLQRSCVRSNQRRTLRRARQIHRDILHLRSLWLRPSPGSCWFCIVLLFVFGYQSYVLFLFIVIAVMFDHLIAMFTNFPAQKLLVLLLTFLWLHCHCNTFNFL